MTLIGETANINYFLQTPLVPKTDEDATNKQVRVKAHMRRQGPGDASKINVPEQMREVLVDPTRTSGSALPGRTVTLVGNPGMINEERRSFTLVGRWVDFHAYLVSHAKMYIYAYNHTGAKSKIKAATP